MPICNVSAQYLPSCNVSAKCLLTPNKCMPNVSTVNNIILDNEMTESLDFGPIPLLKPVFGLPYVDVTDEKAQNAESATSGKNEPVEATATQTPTQIPEQTPAQKSAQKCAMTEVVHAAEKQKQTYMDVASDMIRKMRYGEYIPVVTSEVAPCSHVAIAKLPLQTLDTNSSCIDLTAEPVELLPEDIYDETFARTISNRKEIASRQALTTASKAVRRNNLYRQFLLDESERLISLANAVVPPSPESAKSSFEVFEDDESGDEQGELPDVILSSKDVTPTVRRHSHAKGCHCRVDKKKNSSKVKAYMCDTVGKCNAVKCAYSVIYRLKKKGLGAAPYWELDKTDSTFTHVVGCPSVPKMSQDMLSNAPGFRSAVIHDKGSNIYNLERAALQKGIIRASFSKRKLYRAKQQILLQNARNYEDRFNKLQEWGEGFTEKNPRSMFSIVRDDGRYMCLQTCA